MKSLSEIMLPGSAAANDMRRTLDEIGHTYDAVSNAIVELKSAAFEKGRHGGLRSWAEPRLTPAQFEELDQVFGRLSTADSDYFSELSQIGPALTNEARKIVDRLLAGDDAGARQRIAGARRQLAPLEDKLLAARNEMRAIQTKLGHVSTQGPH